VLQIQKHGFCWILCTQCRVVIQATTNRAVSEKTYIFRYKQLEDMLGNKTKGMQGCSSPWAKSTSDLPHWRMVFGTCLNHICTHHFWKKKISITVAYSCKNGVKTEFLAQNFLAFATPGCVRSNYFSGEGSIPCYSLRCAQCPIGEAAGCLSWSYSPGFTNSLRTGKWILYRWCTVIIHSNVSLSEGKHDYIREWTCHIVSQLDIDPFQDPSDVNDYI
jgi:hypothetical protein